MKTGLLAGNNRLLLCPATVTAVLQAWMDEEFVSPVEVVAVDYESGTSQFSVKFKRKDEEQT